MKISEHFKLFKSQAELDFVDIDLDNDTPLFLDPYFISNLNTDFGKQCDYCIQTFFDSLITYLHDGDIENAQLLLDNVGEINESHLGYSRGKSVGKGTGPMDKHNLLDSLLNSEAVRTKLIEKLEDFRLFIDNVDKDKISDMCTIIIKKYLLEYTEEQCKLWHLPLTDAVSGFFWEPESKSWQHAIVKRLVIFNKPYLLLPKSIVSYSECFSDEKLYQHFVLDYYQDKNLRLHTSLVKTKRDKNGKIVSQYVTKKSIEEDFKSRNIQKTKKWLADFCERHRDILKDFREKAKFAESTLPGSLDVTEDLRLVADALCNEIDEIPIGKEGAYRYQTLCLSIAELLFYPALTNPKGEQDINDRTKRIDIVFSNRAESGFFKLLKDDQIPCGLITMECKNYSEDLGNQEMDQLAGRLTDARGKFGIQFCRKLKNSDLYVKRAKFFARDEKKYIVFIDDKRLKSLLILFKKNPIEEAYSGLLSNWLDEVRIG